MDASSLIFLAIIAVWAVYLLGHWVRRRDQLATARSIDRFSEAMRVLERRTPVQAVAGRSSRPVVVVPTRVLSPSRPSAARVASGSSVTASVGAGAAGAAGAGVTGSVAAGADARLSSRRGAPALGTTVSARPRGAASAMPARGGISAAAARRRARLLAVLGAATAVSWLLVITTPLSLWVALAVSAMLAAVLVQLRRSARAARGVRATRPARTVGARAAERHPSGEAPADSEWARRRQPRTRQDVGAVLAKVRAARAAAGQSTGAVPVTVAQTGRPMGEDVGERPNVATAAQDGVDSGALHAADGGPTIDEPGTWRPVPVPPPTYTLKPKARSAMARIAVTAPVESPASGGQGDAPVPAFDLDEILERRIAAGG